MIRHRFWAYFFIAAACFNALIGLPLWFAPHWTAGLAFADNQVPSHLADMLWGDFGFCVLLIGVGYLFVAFDLKNHAIIWLGIGAKAFDVMTLTSRWFAGVTRTIVLLPAFIDALFIAGFVIFLLKSRQGRV